MEILLEDNHGGYILSESGIIPLASRKAMRKKRRAMRQEGKTKRLETKLARKQERQDSRTEGMRGRRAVQQSRLTKRLTRNEAKTQENMYMPPDETSANTDYYEPETELPTEAELIPDYENEEFEAVESEVVYDEQGLSAGIFGTIAKGAMQVGKALLTPQNTSGTAIPVSRAQYDAVVKQRDEMNRKYEEASQQRIIFGTGGLAVGFALGYLLKK